MSLLGQESFYQQTLVPEVSFRISCCLNRLSAVMQRNGKTQTGTFSVQVLAMSLGGAPNV
jgi:hypothetical protein